MCIRLKAFGRLLAFVLVFSALGCGGSDMASLLPAEESTPDANAATVGSPDFDRVGDLRMVSGERYLKIGDTVESAESFLERPRRSYLLRDLPETFGPAYRARGWEADRQGFGIVSYRDRVAAAVQTVEGVDEATVMDFVASQRAANPDAAAQEVTSAAVRYWFLERDSQRLMICATRTFRKDFAVTVAIGDRQVMEALRMSPDQARNDATRAARQLAGVEE